MASDFKIAITHSSGLAKDEVEKMVSDARSHEAEDKARREEIEGRNRLENLAYQMEKLIKDNKEKLSAGIAKEIEDAIAEAHKIRESGSAAEVKAAAEKLEKASHRAAEELYKSAGQAQGPGPGGDKPKDEPKKDDVVDAEFKQV